MSDGHDTPRSPLAGLPELPPEGEFIRWQGSPNWKDLAISGFHVRKLAVYFALLLLARVVVQSSSGAPFSEALASTVLLSLLAIGVLGFLALYAWLAARGARYTLTNRRLVIRCGATLPFTVNLPFEKIESADLRMRRNGCGDLPITLTKDSRPSWIILWPHVKPWSVTRVKPMFRSVPDAEVVGAQVAEALLEFSDDKVHNDTEPRLVRDVPPAMPAGLSASAG
jgi:hypothetical protein